MFYVVDVCFRRTAHRDNAGSLHGGRRGASMLFANEEEAVALSGGVDVDDAIDRLSREFIEVIVTRGDTVLELAATGVDYDVTTLSDEVVDTTGAGDAATGAYLAVRLRQGSVDESARSCDVGCVTVSRDSVREANRAYRFSRQRARTRYRYVRQLRQL